MIKPMAKEPITEQMEINMLVILVMVKDTAKEPITGRMEK
jgi:hypothetical protein